MRAVVLLVLKGVAITICGSFLIAVFVRLNARVAAEVPWFLIPVAALSLLVARLANFGKSSEPTVLKGSRAAWLSLGVAAALGVTSVVLTGLSSVLSGRAHLPGDDIRGTPLFQALPSLAFTAGAAFVEEAGVRGAVQLRLQRLLSVAVAESVSDVLFVLLHFLWFGAPRELLFVSILSIACGRMAAITQSVRWPIAIHLGANMITFCTVLIGRY